MGNWYTFLARSEHPVARAARRVYRGVTQFTLPAPRVVVRPMLAAYLGFQTAYRFGKRVFIAEPLFKAYCTRYGRGVTTSYHVHFVEGKGRFIVGDNVKVDGKCSFLFAARFSDSPTLTIGDNTGIGNDCAFVVGKAITIGRHCRIAAGTTVIDSSGHPTDPADRIAGLPPRPEEVKPVVIEDNVWIGNRCMIFPGVRVGEGSVVSAGSIVMNDVPPNTVVAGNPARRIAALKPRQVGEPPPAPAQAAPVQPAPTPSAGTAAA